MEQVLRIQSVPVSLTFHTQQAKLEATKAEANLDISRQKNNLTIKSQPVKVKLDTAETMSSAGLKNVRKAISEAANRGVQLGYEATGQITSDGKLLADVHLTQNTIPALAAKSVNTSPLDKIASLIPSDGQETSWEPPEMMMTYEMDKLNFDWRTNSNGSGIKFIPGSLEVEVEQYAKVVIEYVGDPIYIPASSAPGAELEVWA